MTKDEMLKQFFPYAKENNYQEAQRRIAKAMSEGEDHVYLPMDGLPCFSWHVTGETIAQLALDGFKINETWQPAEYYSIEW